MPNYEAMSHVILVLEPENHLGSFVRRVVLFKKRLKYDKKNFTGLLYVLKTKIPFYPC